MKKSLLRATIWVTTLGMTLAILVAPASASIRIEGTPGVTNNSISLGGVFVSSGAPSAVSQPILAGYQLAFKEVDAKGGVNGRKINYTTGNDNYDPSQTLGVVKTLVENDHVFAIAGIFGSDDSNQVVGYLKTSKVPFFDPIGGGANVAGDPWIWQTEPDYAAEGRIIGPYLKGKVKAKKVSVLYQQGTNESEVSVIKKTFPSLQALSYQATDGIGNLGGQFSAIKNFSPDIVVLLGTPVPTASFIKLATENGYKPPKGYFANYPQGDPTWTALAGGYANGALVSSYADLTGKNPVYKAYVNAIHKYDKHQKVTNYGLYGYFNGALMIRALKLSGKKLTRVGLQKTLNTKFRNYKSGFTGTLNWTPNYHYGVKQFKVYKISGSSFKPLTGWLNS